MTRARRGKVVPAGAGGSGFFGAGVGVLTTGSGRFGSLSGFFGSGVFGSVSGFLGSGVMTTGSGFFGSGCLGSGFFGSGSGFGSVLGLPSASRSFSLGSCRAIWAAGTRRRTN